MNLAIITEDSLIESALKKFLSNENIDFFTFKDSFLLLDKIVETDPKLIILDTETYTQESKHTNYDLLKSMDDTSDLFCFVLANKYEMKYYQEHKDPPQIFNRNFDDIDTLKRIVKNISI